MRSSLLLATATLLALATARPAAAGELREPVMTLLSGVEDTPTASELQALGPAAGAELLEIAADPDVARSKRGRAVHALGWFPSDQTRGFLDQTLQSDDKYLARKAVRALATGWQDGALPALTPALQSDDVQLRIATVRALGDISSPKARALLDDRLAVETNGAVQDTIRKVLAQ